MNPETLLIKATAQNRASGARLNDNGCATGGRLNPARQIKRSPLNMRGYNLK